ncbi:cytochrome ubiquinol oxidase subunit II [Pseudomonas typographi]|uniref:Cytochrome ubiquinol oxidase subunit II n=1 Tax=Pseudomonas typographi TaxID=2715964 RepID=A0ABR7Z7S5_9PSED|nr:cytochrome ubiquinol oxidase subunit II [Pseudomonas typographi]
MKPLTPLNGSTVLVRHGVLLALLLANSGCGIAGHGFAAAAGANAASEYLLWRAMVALCLIVVVPVIVLTPWLLRRYRHGRGAEVAYRPRWERSWALEALCWGVPLLVVAAMAMITARQTFQLDPYRAPDSSAALDIQVIALDWKWLFIYPEAHLATLNQLVIPQGRSVHLQLTSAAVMQSFHVPQLSGQIYAMAGMATQLYVRASQPGTYQGRNNQFNGEGFQDQRFTVQVLDEPAFTAWASAAGQRPALLDCAELARLRLPGVEPMAQVYGRSTPSLFGWLLAQYGPQPPGCPGLPEAARP